MGSFQTVFDVRQVGFSDWTGLAMGCSSILIGATLLFKPDAVDRFLTSRFSGARLNMNLRGAWGRGFSGLILLFAILWTGSLIYVTSHNQERLISLLEQGSYRVVEGPLSNVWIGAKTEGFSVRDVSFEYSQFVKTGGFNGGYAFGSPIHDGAYARVTYNGDLILRLEIRKDL